jgi:ATP-dependent RNA helicase DDX52/ROK1
MDVFRTLVGGGVRFDRNRFGGDMKVFEPKGQSQTLDAGPSATHLPKELDFFGDAATAKKAIRELTKDGQEAMSALEGMQAVEESVTKASLKAFLRHNKIKQTGTDVPLPMNSWSELEERYGVEKRLRQNLSSFGWATPTAVQKGAMPVLLEDRDVLVGAPTGSGKTLTFLLPMLHKLHSPKSEGFRAVIVSPTRELAQQIHDQLHKLGSGRKWKICVLTKSSEGALRQDPRSRKRYDILITTPLRLVHAIEQNELDLSNVRQLVLDEADRLLDEGFLQQTDTILAACTHSSLRKALFSATLPAGVEEIAKSFLIDEVRILVGVKDAAVESVQQELKFVSNEDGKLLGLRNMIREGDVKPPALIFVQSIQRAQELFKELVYDDLHVDVIHGERPKAQREAVIDAFKRGEVWIMICTEVLARGIDFKGVEMVINYDFPQSRESYIHRIGRTGRAGRSGKAVTFFTRDDAPHLRSIVNVMRQSGCEVPQWMLDLKKPNQKQKRSLKRSAPDRQDILTVSGAGQGRREANRRRDMVQASKKRKASAADTTDKVE